MRSHRLRRWRLVLGSLTLTGLTLMTAGILLYALQPRFQRTGPDRLAVFSIIVGVLSLLPLFATIVR